MSVYASVMWPRNLLEFRQTDQKVWLGTAQVRIDPTPVPPCKADVQPEMNPAGISPPPRALTKTCARDVALLRAALPLRFAKLDAEKRGVAPDEFSFHSS